MHLIYLGVNIAGARNTWMTGFCLSAKRSTIIISPRSTTLKDILDVCERDNVVAVAIDARLTIALSENTGFRTSDLQLRRLLPPDCRA